MSIASTAGALGKEVVAGVQSAAKVADDAAIKIAANNVERVPSGTVVKDTFTHTAPASAATSAATEAVETTLKAPGFIAKNFSAGKASTHLKTIEAVDTSALKIVTGTADEVVLLGPEGAKFTFKKSDDGVVTLTTQYPEGFGLKGKTDMVVKEETIPTNVASLLEEKQFLTKPPVGEAAPPTAAAAEGAAPTPAAAAAETPLPVTASPEAPAQGEAIVKNMTPTQPQSQPLAQAG